MDDRTEYDFEGLRLDWFRLQVLTSIYKAPLKYKNTLFHNFMDFQNRLWDKDNCQLGWTMNMVSVHSSLVDYFEELLIESSDLSFMWLV